MANCCLFCYRCKSNNSESWSERLLETSITYNVYDKCPFVMTFNRDMFLRNLLKAGFVTYYLKGFFQKPYEYSWVIMDNPKFNDSYYSKVNYTYFYPLDGCDKDFEANFPPLADNFYILYIFLWILLAINLIYLLIEGFYYSRNEIETVNHEHFCSRGIIPKDTLDCKELLFQERQKHLE